MRSTVVVPPRVEHVKMASESGLGTACDAPPVASCAHAVIDRSGESGSVDHTPVRMSGAAWSPRGHSVGLGSDGLPVRAGACSLPRPERLAAEPAGPGLTAQDLLAVRCDLTLVEQVRGEHGRAFLDGWFLSVWIGWGELERGCARMVRG